MTDLTIEAIDSKAWSVLEKLADLHKQATTERSHYYVAGAVLEASALIALLMKELHARSEYSDNNQQKDED